MGAQVAGAVQVDVAAAEYAHVAQEVLRPACACRCCEHSRAGGTLAERNSTSLKHNITRPYVSLRCAAKCDDLHVITLPPDPNCSCSCPPSRPLGSGSAGKLHEDSAGRAGCEQRSPPRRRSAGCRTGRTGGPPAGAPPAPRRSKSSGPVGTCAAPARQDRTPWAHSVPRILATPPGEPSPLLRPKCKPARHAVLSLSNAAGGRS